MTLNTWRDVLNKLAQRAQMINASQLAKDLRPFLEDPADLAWIRTYPQVFNQLLKDQN